MNIVLLQLQNVPLGLFRTHLSNSGDADMNENLVVVIKFELVVM